MSEVTVSSKYQIVIPLAIRRQLDIKKAKSCILWLKTIPSTCYRTTL